MKIALLVLLLYPYHSFAANEKDSIRHRQDTTYIQQFGDKLIIKLDLDNDYIRFNLRGPDFNYDIRPNAGSNRTLSLNYQWAYVGFSFLPEFIVGNKWNERKGKTNGFGVGGGITTPRFLMDLQYVQLNGFYLHNTSDYITGWDPDVDPYIQFPDLSMWMIRGTSLYKSNPNFSLRAIQSQTEAQRKSATSFLPGLAYQYYVIDNQSASSASSQKSNNLMIMGQLNYYATWVIQKKWYATAGIGIGYGFYYTWLTTRLPSGNVESTLTDDVLRGFLNAGLGYNGNRFIAGAEILYYKSFTNQPNHIDMIFTRTAYQVFIGYRFDAPDFLEKGFNKFNSIWN